MLDKDCILQIDKCRTDDDRWIEKIRSNGQMALFYNMHLHFYDGEDDKGNIGVAYEKLTKAEYDAGKRGTKIGYIQKIRTTKNQE